MLPTTLPTAYSVDLTKGINARDLSVWLELLMEDGGNKVYWTARSSWADPNQTVRQKAGRVLMVSMEPGGNEGFHVTVSDFLQWGVIEDPQWLPIVTAKVFTVADGAEVAAKVLATTANWFVW